MTEEEKKEIIETCKRLKKFGDIWLLLNRYIPVIIILIIILTNLITKNL